MQRTWATATRSPAQLTNSNGLLPHNTAHLPCASTTAVNAIVRVTSHHTRKEQRTIMQDALRLIAPERSTRATSAFDGRRCPWVDYNRGNNKPAVVEIWVSSQAPHRC